MTDSNNKIYDAGIVLIERVNPDGTLTLESKERTDKGIELYFKGEVKTLIMSGGYLEGENFSAAECMRDYAFKKGVTEKDILLEDVSLDTVGQIIFSKEGIIIPKKFDKVIIITHDYHATRVIYTANFFFNENYTLKIEGINPEDSIEYRKKKRRDILKISNVITSFGKVPKEESPIESLINGHSWYNGKYPWTYTEERNGNFFRKELERLIRQNS